MSRFRAALFPGKETVVDRGRGCCRIIKERFIASYVRPDARPFLSGGMRSCPKERMTRNETVVVGRRRGVGDVRDGECCVRCKRPLDAASVGRVVKALICIISIRFRYS
jgi:hypothetical protein